jgi:prolyl-tRNA synthetase
MFADWELIGVPHRVVIGERSLKDDLLEYQGRRDEAATPIARADILSFLRSRMI